MSPIRPRPVAWWTPAPTTAPPTAPPTGGVRRDARWTGDRGRPAPDAVGLVRADRHPVGAGGRGDLEGALRRRLPHGDGLVAPRHLDRRAPAARASTPLGPEPGRLAGGAGVRCGSGHDELVDLPVVRTAPARGGGEHRAAGAAHPGARPVPSRGRPPLGPARRGRGRPAGLRGRGGDGSRRAVRAARRGVLGGVHPAERRHRPALAGALRAGARQRGGGDRARAVRRGLGRL